MGRQTIEGFAIVRKAFGKKTMEVKGIGQDTTTAWSDAAYACYPTQWIDAREMIARHPEMKAVPARLTITFLAPEGV
jgi:hypothetical protein